MKENKPVLIRREVTRYGVVGDLFAVYVESDALWSVEHICSCDSVICICDREGLMWETTGPLYKKSAAEHNTSLLKKKRLPYEKTTI